MNYLTSTADVNIQKAHGDFITQQLRLDSFYAFGNICFTSDVRYENVSKVLIKDGFRLNAGFIICQNGNYVFRPVHRYVTIRHLICRLIAETVDGWITKEHWSIKMSKERSKH